MKHSNRHKTRRIKMYQRYLLIINIKFINNELADLDYFTFNKDWKLKCLIVKPVLGSTDCIRKVLKKNILNFILKTVFLWYKI